MLTNAVVAIWVVLVPADAVGAVGVPVKAGEANGALRSRALLIPPLVTALVELAVGVVSIVVAVAEILPSVSEIAEMYLPAPPTEDTSSACMAVVISPDLAKDSNVPFGVSALVVVLPSNETEVLATLLESLASVTTSLSPLAIVMSLVWRVPPFWMFPCVWDDGVRAEVYGSLAGRARV